MNNIQLPKLMSNVVKVGGGFSIQFSVRTFEGDDYVHCEWTPHLPSQRELRKCVDTARYQSALMKFTDHLTRRIGGVE